MTTSVRTKLLTACMISCLTLPPGLAFAGPDEAAKYYEQAAEAYDSGEFARAADLLERAYAEEPDLMYQYNRILALQAMGKFKQSLKVLDVYENPMKEDGRFEDIDEIRAELEQARKDEIAGDTQEDSSPREIARDGDQKKSTQDHADAVEDPPQQTAENPPNILGWSLVGTGVAGLGLAGLFGSTVLISDVADRRACMEPDNTFDPACYEKDGFSGGAAQTQFKEDRDTWQTHQTLTWVFLGVGTAALAGGGVVLLTEGSAESDAAAASTASDAEVRVTPYVGADGAGGVLNISF